MLRFDMLQLDCNDHLYIYDGAHVVATPKVSKTANRPSDTGRASTEILLKTKMWQKTTSTKKNRTKTQKHTLSLVEK